MYECSGAPITAISPYKAPRDEGTGNDLLARGHLGCSRPLWHLRLFIALIVRALWPSLSEDVCAFARHGVRVSSWMLTARVGDGCGPGKCFGSMFSRQVRQRPCSMSKLMSSTQQPQQTIRDNSNLSPRRPQTKPSGLTHSKQECSSRHQMAALDLTHQAD